MSFCYAQVIVDLNNKEVDREFTYLVPQNMQNIKAGMRVYVPFGKQKRLEGIVVSLSEKTDVKQNLLKPILDIIDETVVINQEQLTLAKWMQKKYHAKAAEVFRLFVPSDMRKGKTQFLQMLRLKQNSEQIKQELEQMRSGTKAYRILSTLLEYSDMEKTQMMHIVGECYEPLKKLCAQGLIEIYNVPRQRSPYLDIIPKQDEFLTLNPTQQKTLDAILNAQKYTPFLLHGVTGSGKTEVYMQAINKVVANGKTAIVLVPEISLTPQIVLNFRKKLGSNIAILHSALASGEKFDEWKRILSGEAKIVIGARSAIFAPLENIGLIIIDEEHENSYVSDTHPRYDAIEVAKKRARYNDCPIVLGSATPSVNRYYQAMQEEYILLQMPKRANGKEMPKVQVVDMALEFSSGNKSIFSRELYEKMCKTLVSKKQLMLFLNRRGYSSFVMCRACGETISCENCDVSLTYHNNVDRLRCHYCGYEIPLPKTCPSCGSKFIKQFGAGTQKVEEEFVRLFPQNKVVRMDVDTTRGKDAHYHILKQLASGQAQALIGTQMIAKGHDFPNVELVGVIAADNMLRLPDYRSRERTFSLITQVSGRAGRAQTSGNVIVQTYSPKHFVIECASKHDYKSFYEREIEERRAAWYPPFARFVRILFSSEDAQKSFDASFDAFSSVRTMLEDYKQSLLYSERSGAPINRLKEMYRNQILIKLKEDEFCDEICDKIFEIVKSVDKRNLYCDIQINPVNLF